MQTASQNSVMVCIEREKNVIKETERYLSKNKGVSLVCRTETGPRGPYRDEHQQEVHLFDIFVIFNGVIFSLVWYEENVEVTSITEVSQVNTFTCTSQVLPK